MRGPCDSASWRGQRFSDLGERASGKRGHTGQHRAGLTVTEAVVIVDAEYNIFIRGIRQFFFSFSFFLCFCFCFFTFET